MDIKSNTLNTPNHHYFIIHYPTDSLGSYKDATLTVGKEYLVLNTIKTFTDVYYAILDNTGEKVVVKKLLDYC